MAAVEPQNVYAVTAQGRAPAQTTPGRRRQVVTLGVACALPSLTSVAIGSALRHFGPGDGGRVLAIVHLVVTLAAVVPALFYGVHALRPSAPRRRRLPAPALIALDLAVAHGSALLLHFRPGSVLRPRAAP